MADPDTSGLPVVDPTPGPPCRHLRNKGMYVYTDGSYGEGGEDQGYDSSVYWCLQTMQGFGPDDEVVDGRDCRNASRPCYEPL
jgi:hypothetical protein